MQPDKNYKGIAIGLPCYGAQMEMETRATVSSIRHALAWNRIKSEEYSISLADIVDVRNCILTWFYDGTDFEHLLMIDNDMAFSPDVVFRALDLEKPLVGVVYSKRELQRDANPWPIIVGTPLDTPGSIINGFQRWRYVGGGMMLIHRSLVTEMIQKMPGIVDNFDDAVQPGVTRTIRAFDKLKREDGIVLSEDNSFCERWGRCGGEVWAGVDFPIGHIGRFNYCIQATELLGLKKLHAA